MKKLRQIPIHRIRLDLFFAKVDMQPGEDSCWLWTASTCAKLRYGQFQVGGDSYTAHRVSWVIANHRNPPQDKPFVLHRCDVPRCVRPSHLFVGTPQDNVDDMMKKGRDVWRPIPIVIEEIPSGRLPR